MLENESKLWLFDVLESWRTTFEGCGEDGDDEETPELDDILRKLEGKRPRLTIEEYENIIYFLYCKFSDIEE